MLLGVLARTTWTEKKTVIRTESIYAARPPRHPIYGVRQTTEADMRDVLYERILKDRSKTECYQFEPIYGISCHLETTVTSYIKQQTSDGEPIRSVFPAERGQKLIAHLF